MKVWSVLTVALVSTPLLSQQCATEEPSNTGDIAFCSASEPEANCPCLVEEELACTDDGYVHEQAFICMNGQWQDHYGSATANSHFCPDHEDFIYNYCAWIEGEVWANCTF